MKEMVLPEPISPELALVLPEVERRALLAALTKPDYHRPRVPARQTTPEAPPLSGLPLVKAAAAYAGLRILTAVPHYAITVVPVVVLLTLLSLVR
jgi:hypothetical protein